MTDMLVNAYSTLRHPSAIEFPCHDLAHRDASDHDFPEHLNGLLRIVSDGGRREMNAILYAVIQHLQRSRHQYRFRLRTEDLPIAASWGWQANAIFWLPNGDVTDPSSRILVNHQTGLADESASVPYPPDAVTRSQNTRQHLDQMGVPTLADLPPAVGEAEVVLRAADEIAWRALSLFIVAVRAESLASGNPIPVDKLREKSPMAFQSLTPQENEFLSTDSPDPQDVINAAWRYEALYTLQWALGLHRDLRFADSICDVPMVAQTMVDREDVQIVNEAQTRDVGEILDAVEWNQRLLWAARQAAINQSPPPKDVDGGVLSERQHALNWLVQLHGAPWDHVDTPT